MKLHRNARLTPVARRLLVHRVRDLGWQVKQAAEAGGVSRRTAHKWLWRFEESGEAGLEDRSSRPLRSPGRTPARIVQAIDRLRRRRQTAWEIARELGVPRSTVSRVLARLGLGRLWRVVEAEALPRRYEHEHPGGLAPHRRQEARQDPEDRPPHPRRSQSSLRGSRLGDRLHLRR